MCYKGGGQYVPGSRLCSISNITLHKDLVNEAPAYRHRGDRRSVFFTNTIEDWNIAVLEEQMGHACVSREGSFHNLEFSHFASLLRYLYCHLIACTSLFLAAANKKPIFQMEYLNLVFFLYLHRNTRRQARVVESHILSLASILLQRHDAIYDKLLIRTVRVQRLLNIGISNIIPHIKVGIKVLTK